MEILLWILACIGFGSIVSALALLYLVWRDDPIMLEDEWYNER